MPLFLRPGGLLRHKIVRRAVARFRPVLEFRENGFRYAVDLGDMRGPANHLFRSGLASYESEVVDALVSALAPGETLLDVGANCGLIAMRVAAARRDCFVEAYEPEPRAFALLRRNRELNALANLEIHNVGLADKPGEHAFFADPDNRGGYSIVRQDHLVAHGSIRVVRLDDARPAGRRIGAIKVDIEGYEPQFFEGAERTIERDRPFIAFEYSGHLYARLGLSPLVTSEKLRGWGYELAEIESGRGLEDADFLKASQSSLPLNVAAVPRR